MKAIHDNSGRRLICTVAGVFVVALLIRICLASWAVVTPLSDFHGYDFIAWNWLQTGEITTSLGRAYRTPGYPGALAVIYTVFGHNHRAAMFLNAVLGGISVALLTWIGVRTVSLRTGLLAGLLLAFSPTALAYTPVLASENLATPLLLGGLALLLADPDRSARRMMLAGGAGLLFGLLLLTRPAALFFAPAFALLALYDPRSRRWYPVRAGMLVTITVLTLTPWLVRNGQIGLGPVLSTAGGVNLWMGNNPRASDGGYCSQVQWDSELGEAKLDRAYREAAVQWITRNPLTYVRLCGVRAARLLGTQPDGWVVARLIPTAENDKQFRAHYIAQCGKPVAPDVLEKARAMLGKHQRCLLRIRRVSVPLTVLALLLALRRWRGFAIVLLPAGCYLLGISCTFVSERFRELLNPLVMIPVAALLVDLLAGEQNLGDLPNRVGKTVLILLAIGISIVASKAGWLDSLYRLS